MLSYNGGSCFGKSFLEMRKKKVLNEIRQLSDVKYTEDFTCVNLKQFHVLSRVLWRIVHLSLFIWEYRYVLNSIFVIVFCEKEGLLLNIENCIHVSVGGYNTGTDAGLELNNSNIFSYWNRSFALLVPLCYDWSSLEPSSSIARYVDCNTFMYGVEIWCVKYLIRNTWVGVNMFWRNSKTS